jgi:pantetheine-phosphate adenylyltransferase
MATKTKIIYPGTFDPITYGHIDIIDRAAQLFDQVMVAVVMSAQKATAFSGEERHTLVKKALAKHKNVEVVTFSGLLVDFAREQKVFSVLRGMRAISDFEYEFQMAALNREMEPRFETVFLMPSEKYAYLSASMVREIARLGGDVSKFVPRNVCLALQKLYKVG